MTDTDTPPAWPSAPEWPDDLPPPPDRPQRGPEWQPVRKNPRPPTTDPEAEGEHRKTELRGAPANGPTQFFGNFTR